MECVNTRPASLIREVVSTAGAAVLVMLFGGVLLLGDPSYYWRDDYQLNYLPKFQEIARSLHQGEFPLLTSLTWQAGDIGGEYQFGIFSIWLLVCFSSMFSLGLSLPLTAALLSLVHLGVLAAGAFRLARGQNLRGAESTLVAVTTSLNGWVLVWGAMNWFVALASLAWLPWIWWSLERALASPRPARAVVLTGGFFYLALAAAWHFTALMLGVLSIWLTLRSLASGRRVRELWPLPAAWALGLGLSAPAWLMYLEYSPHTVRGQTPLSQLQWVWTVPLSSLPGLILPAHICSWSVFNFGWQPHRCVELAGAFVPLAVFVAAFFRLGLSWLRQIGWELPLAGLTLLFAMLPSAGNVQWSFRWLPLFFLVLGLMAGRGLSALQRHPASGLLSSAGLWAAGLSTASLVILQAWPKDRTLYDLRYCVVVLAFCLVWIYLEKVAPRTRPWLPSLVGLACLGFFYAAPTTFLEVPSWEVRLQSGSSCPLSPATRYLSLCTPKDIFKDNTKREVIDLYPGNCCLYDGYEFLNGYSPLRLTGLTSLFDFLPHGVLTHAGCERILLHEAGPHGLLELLGVDGLLVSHDFASFLPHLQANGWEVTAKRDGGTVLHRHGLPSPRVRFIERVQWNGDTQAIYEPSLQQRDGPVPLLVEDAPPWPGVDGALGKAELRVLAEDRCSVQLHVRTEDSKPGSLIAVSRPWYPGYIARFNGEPIPLYRLNQVIPAVLLPAGVEGSLVLEYRPRSLAFGLIISAATLLLSVGLLLPWRKSEPRL